MKTPKHLVDPNYKRVAIAPRPRPRGPPERVVFLEDSVSVWAWPSRGGLIVLERATSLDFDYLGLSTVNPPLTRDEDKDAEDDLCQRLLQLGAKWFDSRERYGFVANVATGEEPEIEAIENGEQPAPTAMERQWVSVAVKPDGTGFWIAEYEVAMRGYQDKHNLVPRGATRVALARTMEEKCEILEMMGAKCFNDWDQYNGSACINAWEKKTTGEVGLLVQR